MTTVREGLERAAGVIPRLPNHIKGKRLMERIAPIIERALRKAYKQAADDYNETAPEGCLAVCTSTDNGVTAGVAEMMEEK